MVSATSDNSPRLPCGICSSSVVDGICPQCGARAADVEAVFDAHAQSLPQEMTSSQRHDLQRLLDQTTNHSEDLWRLTSPKFQAMMIEAETERQLASLRRRALIMVPSALLVLLLSLLLVCALSSALGLTLFQHSMMSLLAVVFSAFPVLLFAERFACQLPADSAVPVSVFLSAIRRVRIPLILKAEFQFPLILLLASLVSVLLYQPA